MKTKHPNFPKLLSELLSNKTVHVETKDIYSFVHFASYVADVYGGAVTETGQYLYIE